MEVEGVTRLKKYSELSAAEAIQADCDVKATNIILQGLPPEVYALVSTHKVSKELWEMIQMLMQGTSLTKQERECKLYDAFDKFAYQKGETLHDFYLRFSLILNDINMYNMKLEQFQFVSQGPSSLTHSISYPVTDTSSLVNHNSYMTSSSAPQIDYALMVQQSSEYSPPEAGLVVPVFQKGDDLIDAINHMMSFLTLVLTSRRKRDAEWFKDKVLLVQAQANGQVLQEEELEFLADPDFEVAFRQHTCFIRNLDGVDLLTGFRGNNLYTLSLQDMMASSPICLLSKASKTKSWLWHRRLSHLNFGAINHLARQGLVRGLPKLKFEKVHLCSACAMGKSTRKTHKPKFEDTNQEKLYLLHMDLCGPMHRIRTDNGTEFVNHTLRDYYEEVGISHETSVARSPQQNGVVERRNRTLIKAAYTMLIYAQALLFLWADAVATAYFTQNRSIICLRHEKTSYELLHNKLLDLLFFHVFGALCYPTNDSENLGKLQPKVDIEIFIGYAPTKKAFRIYNRRTRRIVETIHVDFDELTAMASEQCSSGPALNEMTPGTISSGLVHTTSPSTSYVPPSRND
nr:retrovirus-related Pol polyprotein from transposon TNT 1-94 [Tanacetum cinerariifolium]